MNGTTPSLLGIVEDWLGASALYDTRRRHTPSRSRLAKRCLVPLLHEFVDPTPADTYPQRVTALLNDLETALAADLAAASDEVGHILKALGTQAPGLLTPDDIQTRVAITLRTLLRPMWTQVLTGGERFRPVWHGEHQHLREALTQLTHTRMCKLWAAQVSALDPDDFELRWTPVIADLVATTGPHPPSSVDAGLGDLSTPNPVAQPIPAREWRLATDRSFHNRLCLYWDGRHLPTDPPPESSPSARLADSDDPGNALLTETLQRTVAPFGLNLPEHQVLAGLLADAVSAGATDNKSAADSPSLPQAWSAAARSTASLRAAVQRHVRIRLRRQRIPADEFDEVLLGQFVARRVWVRLHAWELLSTRIPARELLVATNTALDVARQAAGVTRSFPLDPPKQSRIANTIAVIAAIRASTCETDAQQVLQQYRRRYNDLRFDRDLQGRGGVLTPRQVERLLTSRGGT